MMFCSLQCGVEAFTSDVDAGSGRDNAAMSAAHRSMRCGKGFHLRSLLLSGALLAASSALAPLAAQQDWTASIETPAERAYRAVEERSLAMPKQGVKSANGKRKRAKAAPVAAAVIPDMPERPDLPERKFIAAPPPAVKKPEEDVFVTDPPKEKPPSETQALAEPLITAPKGLGDVLTTQVLSEPEPAGAAEPKPVGAALPQTNGDQYCKGINNAAADARFAWQKQTLADTEKQVEKRVEELNARIAEYQNWMARRDDFSRKAQATITDIYAKMKPDAAALQLSALNEETAAAVLTKLSPKISSALMAEMDAKKAARLTTIISASAKGPKGKLPAPPAAPPANGGP
jgi:flagellar motility protein MotE (MotC chaperone)